MSDCSTQTTKVVDSKVTVKNVQEHRWLSANIYLHIHLKTAVAICRSLVFCRLKNIHGLRTAAKPAYNIAQHAVANIMSHINTAVNGQELIQRRRQLRKQLQS